MELIDKSAVVAEIERRIKENEEIGTYLSPKGTLTNLLCYINTLEVKDVNFEKEVHSQMDLLCNLLSYMDELSNGDSEGVYPLPINVNKDLQRFAKHFFELGLKARKEE